MNDKICEDCGFKDDCEPTCHHQWFTFPTTNRRICMKCNIEEILNPE